MAEFDLAKLREMLEKELEEKIQEVERLPERYVFQEGQELFCKIKKIIDNPWREGGKIYIVEDLDTGGEYRLPTHRVLEQELEKAGAREGDIALIKLVRSYQKESPEGMRTVFVYRVAVHRENKPTSSGKKEYLDELFKLFNGEIPEDQFKYFIEIRGWKPEEVIKEFNLKVENGVVRHD